jgi:hypothetical protein
VACLGFAAIAIFGPEPSITINQTEVRCVRGKHARVFSRQEIAFCRYSRTHVSYVTFLRQDGSALYKPIPIAVDQAEIERAMRGVGIPLYPG